MLRTEWLHTLQVQIQIRIQIQMACCAPVLHASPVWCPARSGEVLAALTGVTVLSIAPPPASGDMPPVPRRLAGPGLPVHQQQGAD
jgi:hypothetical protein